MNEQIRIREVCVVSDDRSQVVPTEKVLDLVHQQGVDLVGVPPKAQPSVCRLADYSKFSYRQKKHVKEMKQKQVKVEMKEIRFGPQTDEHDYQFKLRHVQGFPSKGNKAHAYVFFRGRSILLKEQGEVLLLRLVNDLEEYGEVEQMLKLKGKRVFLYLTSKKVGVEKKSQQKRNREQVIAEAKVAKKAISTDGMSADDKPKGGLFDNAKNGSDALKKLQNEE